MHVALGTPAPARVVTAYVKGEPEPVELALPAGGEWTILFFYPRDFTFVCPTELAAFEEARPEFEALGGRLVAASTDSWWVHRAWFESSPWLQNVAYPVVGDPA